jgi:hypothetical protein
MGGTCSKDVRDDKCVDVWLVGVPQDKRPLGRPRCSWTDSTKLHLTEYDLRFSQQ